VRAPAIALALACGCGRLGFGDGTGAPPGDGRSADVGDAPSDGSATTGDVGDAGSGFLDTFDRPDSATLGNGWTAETAGVFSITGDQVTRVTSSSTYDQNLVYRPAAEADADLEVSIEFTFANLAGGPDWPQMFVRAQASPLAGYFLWVEDDQTAALALQQPSASPSSTWVSLGDMTLPAFTTTDRYRLRLRATGAHPTQLDAWVEIQDGAAWDIEQQVHTTDGSTDELTAAGLHGFGGHTGATGGPYVYDNFRADPQ
jgi:hypothetical protein